MKIKTQLQARLSHHYGIKRSVPPNAQALVADTSELEESEEPNGTFTYHDGGIGEGPDNIERVELIVHPQEDIHPGHVLISARSVSIELSIAELVSALMALRETDGVRE